MELIVFDLDGTLLDANSKISPYTQETLSLLSQNKIAYTVATGRTLHSAKQILAGHGFNLPHIYSNGVLIWDPRAEHLSLKNVLTVSETEHVLRATALQQVTPFVSTVNTQHQHCIYHSPIQHSFERRLVDEFLSRPEVRLLPIEELPRQAHITNISVLGTAPNIDAIDQHISNETHLIAYSGPAIEGDGLKWMDIHHSEANKGGAVQLLREQLGITKVVCFGDSDNDLSMFALADESYAPDNAKQEVKTAATDVIGHHDADGIARFLRERFSL